MTSINLNSSDYLMNELTQFPTLIELLNYRADNQPQQIAYTFLGNGENESERLTY